MARLHLLVKKTNKINGKEKWVKREPRGAWYPAVKVDQPESLHWGSEARILTDVCLARPNLSR